MEWVHRLYEKTAQPSIQSSLKELQCTKYTEKQPIATKVVENLVCSNLNNDAEDNNVNENDDEEEEEESEGTKTYLMTILSNELHCPIENRPTPITVKQRTTSERATTTARAVAPKAYDSTFTLIGCTIIALLYLI